MTSQEELTERRSRLATILSARIGQPTHISWLRTNFGLARDVVQSDLKWLARFRGMVFNFPKRDIVVFERVKQLAVDEPLSARGYAHPILGLCDNCNKPFLLNGRKRFCGEPCRMAFARLPVHEQHVLLTNKLELLGSPLSVTELPTAEDIAAARRRIEDVISGHEPAPLTLEIEQDPEPFKDGVDLD